MELAIHAKEVDANRPVARRAARLHAPHLSPGENGALDDVSRSGTLPVLRTMTGRACRVPGLPTAPARARTASRRRSPRGGAAARTFVVRRGLVLHADPTLG